MDLIADYKSRLNKVFEFIENNIDKEITLDSLASASNFSKFHFSRLFSALVGESPFEFIHRTRLERASILLKLQNSKVSEIASKCGFEDITIFSRAFKKHFYCSPTEWRKFKTKNSNKSQLAQRTAEYFCSDLKPYNMEQLISAEVKQLPTISVAYIRHTGPYSKMEAVYDKLVKRLIAWASENGIAKKSELQTVIIHHDDPTVTPDEKQRTSICITVPPDTKVSGEIGKMEIRSGKYLAARFVLEANEIENAWRWIYGTWFPESGYQPGDTIPYQFYPVPPENGKLTIEFRVPVKSME